MPKSPKKNFRDLAPPQQLKLVFFGFGAIFPLFFVTTAQPVFVPIGAQLGCLTAFLLLRRGWLGGSYVPAIASAAGFLVAIAATCAYELV